MGYGLGVPFALKQDLRIIDGACCIGQEDKLQVDFFRCAFYSTGDSGEADRRDRN